ncbi:MAG: SIR2 family protein, partial [Candidatus Hodarchaeota archaeon]
MEEQWTWTTASEDITLDSLFQSQDKLCFLVGSGISLDSPSCLPTGYQFTKALLEQLIPTDVRSKILELMDPNRENMHSSGDFLRFEQLMEYLQTYDPDLHVLDLYSNCKTPNFNHLFLAKMLKQGHKVTTTNFDNLIEYALMKMDLSEDQIFPLISRQDWEQRSNESHCIYKLHGSLVDFQTGQDCRESLQATMVKIGQDKSEVFHLELWKRQALHDLFQSYDLLFLGYSGLDDFDVLPTLRTIHSPKRLLWISHDAECSLDDAKIEVLKVNPANTLSTNRTRDNIIQFNRYRSRQPENLIHISVNTTELLEWMWKKYIQDPISLPTDASSPCPEKEFSLPISMNLSEG